MNVLVSDMSFFSLNNFDFLILGIIGFSSLFALVRGFIKSFISLSGWIASMAIGMKFYFILEPIVSKYIALGVVAAVISGICLFLISAIIIAIVNNIFYIALESISGGLLDRSLGLLFGFLRGCLLVSFTFYILLMIMPQLNVKDKKELSYSSLPKWAKNSETIFLLGKGASLIDELMPSDFERKLKKVLSNKESIEKESRALDETQHSGASAIVTNANEDSIADILSLLPKEVISNVSAEDLASLQNKLVSHKEKIKILEEISKKYQEHMNDERNLETLSQEDIDKKNLGYYKLMSIIENQIIEYNH